MSGVHCPLPVVLTAVRSHPMTSALTNWKLKLSQGEHLMTASLRSSDFRHARVCFFSTQTCRITLSPYSRGRLLDAPPSHHHPASHLLLKSAALYQQPPLEL